MRKGVSILSEALIQLTVAALVIGLIWIPFTNQVISSTTFQESAYAMDNALTLEAMQVSDHGNMRVAYLLEANQFYFTVADGRFIAGSEERGGVERYFLVNEGIEVVQHTFQPSFYQYFHTTAQMSTAAARYTIECPDALVSPGWPREGKIVLQDDTVFADTAAVREAARLGLGQSLLNRGEAVLADDDPGDAFMILFAKHNGPTRVQYKEGSERSARFACLLAKELSPLNNDVVLVEPDRDSKFGHEGVRIHFPDDFYDTVSPNQLREIQRASSTALEQFLRGGP